MQVRAAPPGPGSPWGVGGWPCAWLEGPGASRGCGGRGARPPSRAPRRRRQSPFCARHLPGAWGVDQAQGRVPCHPRPRAGGLQGQRVSRATGLPCGHARSAEGARASETESGAGLPGVSPQPRRSCRRARGLRAGCWSPLSPSPAIPHSPRPGRLPRGCSSAQGAPICSPHEFPQTPPFTGGLGVRPSEGGGLPQQPEGRAEGGPLEIWECGFPEVSARVPGRAMSPGAGSEPGASAQVLGRPRSVSPQRPPGLSLRWLRARSQRSLGGTWARQAARAPSARSPNQGSGAVALRSEQRFR